MHAYLLFSRGRPVLVYNNALPMFCYVRIIFDMTETGHMSTVVMVEGMNLQE